MEPYQGNPVRLFFLAILKGTMTRILNVSDVHVDTVTAGFVRFDDISETLWKTVHKAIDERFDYYLFTGDFCDPDGGGDSFGYARLAIRLATRLADAGIKSIWMAGNHDVVESGNGYTTLSPLRAVSESKHYRGLIEVFEEPGIMSLEKRLGDIPSAGFLALPFTSHDRNYDPAKALIELVPPDLTPGKIPIIVAGHLNIEGIEIGSETTDFPRGRDVFFPQQACDDLVKAGHSLIKVNGHYHKQQVFEGIHIPGSVANLTFGEEDYRPGYQVIEV